MFGAPSFFIDGDGELVDIREIKAILSYAMYTRKFYSPFDEKVQSLYEEYSTYFTGKNADSESLEQLYSEYEEKLERIKTELNEAKKTLVLSRSPGFL